MHDFSHVSRSHARTPADSQTALTEALIDAIAVPEPTLPRQQIGAAVAAAAASRR